MDHTYSPHQPPFAPSRGGFGAQIEWHASVASTMPLAHNWAEQREIPSGAVVIADEQTAGKGRMGRRWLSPPGRSLMASFLLRSTEHPIAANRLGMVAAIGVLGACRAAVRTGHSLLCKWPNDLVSLDAEGTPRKVAGILIESSITGARWSHAVIGIGINVNHTRGELPSVTAGALAPWSLRLARDEAGQEQREQGGEIDHGEIDRGEINRGEINRGEINRGELFSLLCEHLNRVATLSSDAIFEAWRASLWMPEREVALWQGNTVLARGNCAGVDDEGQLLLRDGAGDVRAWSAVDLSLRLV